MTPQVHDARRVEPTAAPGLYLHIPFCSAICPYCDFSVLTGTEDHRVRFLASLAREIELWSSRATSSTEGEDPAVFASIDTIYLGGGTPSALGPDQLSDLLDLCRQKLPVVQDPWIQFEANPEDATLEAVRAWRDLGIDTLSLGVQSFEDGALAFLGRRHSGADARNAVTNALEAGFAAVSIDLIFGLPEQTPERWQRDLDQAIALSPHHISCYQLTLHDGTSFGFRRDRGQLHEMPNPEQAELFRLTHRRLGDHGYQAYEVSNFARHPADRSRHNQKYWNHSPYLGFGPSAHSFTGRHRWWNERKLPTWTARIAQGELPVADSEELTPSELILESLMLGLRTPAGVDLPALERRYGLDLLARNQGIVERLVREHLVVVDSGRLQPTLDGLAVADSLAVALETGS